MWLPETFDALSEAGVFRMTAPARYGGYEADFQTQCDVLAEIARGCPSTSWVATILSAMSWLAGVFPDEAQDEIFRDGDPRISGVFSPRERDRRSPAGSLSTDDGDTTPAGTAARGPCSTRSFQPTAGSECRRA